MCLTTRVSSGGEAISGVHEPVMNHTLDSGDMVAVVDYKGGSGVSEKMPLTVQHRSFSTIRDITRARPRLGMPLIARKQSSRSDVGQQADACFSGLLTQPALLDAQRGGRVRL